MANSDAEFYKDPANIKPGRRVTPSQRAPMTGHVPVRFAEPVIARVKTLATQDGVTVSTWIRNLVLKELERRSVPRTGLSVVVSHMSWTTIPTPQGGVLETMPSETSITVEEPSISVAS